jgi:hypothetical protein
MDSSIHTLVASIYTQDRIRDVARARQADVLARVASHDAVREGSPARVGPRHVAGRRGSDRGAALSRAVRSRFVGRA